jgi:hypothetical protein
MKMLQKSFKAKNDKMKYLKNTMSADVRARFDIIKDKCLFCGTKKDLAFHHEDYAKIHDVVVLCRRCHEKYHHEWFRFIDLSDNTQNKNQKLFRSLFYNELIL